MWFLLQLCVLVLAVEVLLNVAIDTVFVAVVVVRWVVFCVCVSDRPANLIREDYREEFM